MAIISWNSIFSLGLILGLFLGAILLIQRHGNRSAARLLAAIVTLIAAGILAELFQPELDPRWALLLACLNVNTELAFGPLIFLLVRVVLLPERGPCRGDFVHFLPWAAGCALWLRHWAGVMEPEIVLFAGLNTLLPLLPYLAYKATVMLCYLGSAIAMIGKAIRSGRRYTDGKRGLRLRPLRGWLLALSLVPTLIYLSAFADAYGAQLRIEPDALSGLLLTAVLFVVLSLLLMRPWLLSINVYRAPNAGLSRDGSRLRASLDRDRQWLDPDLDLATLANAMGWSVNHLSRVINQALGSSFYALLADYRLGEFERLARDPGSRRKPVLDLALEAGFNSKASFYRAFRRRHDAMTPTEYREAIAAS